MKKQHYRRLIALGILVCFASSLFQEPAQAQISLPAPSQTQKWPEKISGIQLSAELGKIIEVREGTSVQKVIVLQDAHSIPDAQRSIEKIIRHFQKEYGVRHIALEGASDVLDAQIFKSFPDKDTLRKVLESYYEKGELTGGTAAAVLNEDETAVFKGVEDWELYEKGQHLYTEALQEQPALEIPLKKWAENLEAQKTKIYSSQLLEIDRSLRFFYANKENLLLVLKKLSAVKSPEAGSSLALLLSELKNSEKRFSETRLIRTAREIRRILESKHAAKDLRGWQENFQAFQTSQISAAAFTLFLKETAAKHKLDIKFPPGLSREAQDFNRLKEIEGPQFFREFENYAAEVKAALLHSEDEKKLNEESEWLARAEHLARLELTRDDWQKIRSASGKEPQAWREIAEKAKTHFAFYQNAESREEVLLRGLTSWSPEPVLFVAGGFHTEGLIQKLAQAGSSYLLVTPSISNIPKQVHYQDHMRGEVSWKKYFTSKNGKINLYDSFVRGTRDKLMETKENTSVKFWRDQIIRDLAKSGKIESAAEYTHFLDEVAGSGGAESFFAPVDRFIAGLERLQQHRQVSVQNILQILNPAAAPAGYLSAALQKTAVFSDRRVEHRKKRTEYIINRGDHFVFPEREGWVRGTEVPEKIDGYVYQTFTRAENRRLHLSSRPWFRNLLQAIRNTTGLMVPLMIIVTPLIFLVSQLGAIISTLILAGYGVIHTGFEIYRLYARNQKLQVAHEMPWATFAPWEMTREQFDSLARLGQRVPHDMKLDLGIIFNVWKGERSAAEIEGSAIMPWVARLFGLGVQTILFHHKVIRIVYRKNPLGILALSNLRAVYQKYQNVLPYETLVSYQFEKRRARMDEPADIARYLKDKFGYDEIIRQNGLNEEGKRQKVQQWVETLNELSGPIYGEVMYSAFLFSQFNNWRRFESSKYKNWNNYLPEVNEEWLEQGRLSYMIGSAFPELDPDVDLIYDARFKDLGENPVTAQHLIRFIRRIGIAAEQNIVMDPTVTEILLMWSLVNPVQQVRQEGLIALGKLRNMQGGPDEYFKRVFEKTHENPAVRATALGLLISRGDYSVLEDLLEEAQIPGNHDVVVAAIEELGKNRSLRSFDYLAQILDFDDEGFVESALDALGNWGTAGAWRLIYSQLFSTRQEVVLMALRELGQHKNPDSLPPLLGHLRYLQTQEINEGNEAIAVAALQLLGSFTPMIMRQAYDQIAPVSEILTYFYEHPNLNVSAAAQIIFKQFHQAVIDHLMPLEESGEETQSPRSSEMREAQDRAAEVLAKHINARLSPREQVPLEPLKSRIIENRYGTQGTLYRHMTSGILDPQKVADLIVTLEGEQLKSAHHLTSEALKRISVRNYPLRLQLEDQIFRNAQRHGEVLKRFKIVPPQDIPGQSHFWESSRFFPARLQTVPIDLFRESVKALPDAKILALFPPPSQAERFAELTNTHIVDAIAFGVYYERVINGKKTFVISSIQSDSYPQLKEDAELKKLYKDWRWVMRAALELEAAEQGAEVILSPTAETIHTRWPGMGKSAELIYDIEMEKHHYSLVTIPEGVAWERGLSPQIWWRKTIDENSASTEILKKIFVRPAEPGAILQMSAKAVFDRFIPKDALGTAAALPVHYHKHESIGDLEAGNLPENFDGHLFEVAAQKNEKLDFIQFRLWRIEPESEPREVFMGTLGFNLKESSVVLGVGKADGFAFSFPDWVIQLKHQARKMGLQWLVAVPKLRRPDKGYEKYEGILRDAGFQPPAPNSGTPYWVLSTRGSEMRKNEDQVQSIADQVVSRLTGLSMDGARARFQNGGTYRINGQTITTQEATVLQPRLWFSAREIPVVRIGTMVFVGVRRAGPTLWSKFWFAVENMIWGNPYEVVFKQIKDLYQSYPNYILLAAAPSYSNPASQSPVPLVARLTVATVLAYADNIYGKSVLDLGAGEGLLSRMALKLGARRLSLLDHHHNLVQASGGRLARDGARNFSLYTADLENLPGDLKNEMEDVEVALINIGARKMYGNANEAAVLFAKDLPRVKVIINGGHPDENEIFSELAGENTDAALESLQQALGEKYETEVIQESTRLRRVLVAERSESRAEAVSRKELVRRIVEKILAERTKKQTHAGGPAVYRVAIDGFTAAGKTELNKEIAAELERRGLAVVRSAQGELISGDFFLKSRSVREKDEDKHFAAKTPVLAEWESHYDLNRLRQELLVPLAAFNETKSSSLLLTLANLYDRQNQGKLTKRLDLLIKPESVLVMDGEYLLHDNTRDFFDLKIWLDVDHEISFSRRVQRDTHAAPRLRNRYDYVEIPSHEAHQINRDFADIIVNQDDLTKPVIQKGLYRGESRTFSEMINAWPSLPQIVLARMHSAIHRLPTFEEHDPLWEGDLTAYDNWLAAWGSYIEYRKTERVISHALTAEENTQWEPGFLRAAQKISPEDAAAFLMRYKYHRLHDANPLRDEVTYPKPLMGLPPDQAYAQRYELSGGQVLFHVFFPLMDELPDRSKRLNLVEFFVLDGKIVAHGQSVQFMNRELVVASFGLYPRFRGQSGVSREIYEKRIQTLNAVHGSHMDMVVPAGQIFDDVTEKNSVLFYLKLGFVPFDPELEAEAAALLERSFHETIPTTELNAFYQKLTDEGSRGKHFPLYRGEMRENFQIVEVSSAEYPNLIKVAERFVDQGAQMFEHGEEDDSFGTTVFLSLAVALQPSNSQKLLHVWKAVNSLGRVVGMLILRKNSTILLGADAREVPEFVYAMNFWERGKGGGTLLLKAAFDSLRRQGYRYGAADILNEDSFRVFRKVASEKEAKLIYLGGQTEDGKPAREFLIDFEPGQPSLKGIPAPLPDIPVTLEETFRSSLHAETRQVQLDDNLEMSNAYDLVIEQWLQAKTGETTITADDGAVFRVAYRDEGEDDRFFGDRQRLTLYQDDKAVGYAHFRILRDGTANIYASFNDDSFHYFSAFEGSSSEFSEGGILGGPMGETAAILINPVMTNAQYHGLGTSLMALALRIARARGAKHFDALTVYAPKFFEKIGFVKTRERTAYNGEKILDYTFDFEKNAAKLPKIQIVRKSEARAAKEPVQEVLLEKRVEMREKPQDGGAAVLYTLIAMAGFFVIGTKIIEWRYRNRELSASAPQNESRSETLRLRSEGRSDMDEFPDGREDMVREFLKLHEEPEGFDSPKDLRGSGLRVTDLIPKLRKPNRKQGDPMSQLVENKALKVKPYLPRHKAGKFAMEKQFSTWREEIETFIRMTPPKERGKADAVAANYENLFFQLLKETSGNEEAAKMGAHFFKSGVHDLHYLTVVSFMFSRLQGMVRTEMRISDTLAAIPDTKTAWEKTRSTANQAYLALRLAIEDRAYQGNKKLKANELKKLRDSLQGVMRGEPTGNTLHDSDVMRLVQVDIDQAYEALTLMGEKYAEKIRGEMRYTPGLEFTLDPQTKVLTGSYYGQPIFNYELKTASFENLEKSLQAAILTLGYDKVQAYEIKVESFEKDETGKSGVQIVATPRYDGVEETLMGTRRLIVLGPMAFPFYNPKNSAEIQNILQAFVGSVNHHVGPFVLRADDQAGTITINGLEISIDQPAEDYLREIGEALRRFRDAPVVLHIDQFSGWATQIADVVEGILAEGGAKVIRLDRNEAREIEYVSINLREKVANVLKLERWPDDIRNDVDPNVNVFIPRDVLRVESAIYEVIKNAIDGSRVYFKRYNVQEKTPILITALQSGKGTVLQFTNPGHLALDKLRTHAKEQGVYQLNANQDASLWPYRYLMEYLMPDEPMPFHFLADEQIAALSDHSLLFDTKGLTLRSKENLQRIGLEPKDVVGGAGLGLKQTWRIMQIVNPVEPISYSSGTTESGVPYVTFNLNFPRVAVVDAARDNANIIESTATPRLSVPPKSEMRDSKDSEAFGNKVRPEARRVFTDDEVRPLRELILKKVTQHGLEDKLTSEKLKLLLNEPDLTAQLIVQRLSGSQLKIQGAQLMLKIIQQYRLDPKTPLFDPIAWMRGPYFEAQKELGLLRAGGKLTGKALEAWADKHIRPVRPNFSFPAADPEKVLTPYEISDLSHAFETQVQIPLNFLFFMSSFKPNTVALAEIEKTNLIETLAGRKIPFYEVRPLDEDATGGGGARPDWVFMNMIQEENLLSEFERSYDVPEFFIDEFFQKVIQHLLSRYPAPEAARKVFESILIEELSHSDLLYFGTQLTGFRVTRGKAASYVQTVKAALNPGSSFYGRFHTPDKAEKDRELAQIVFEMEGRLNVFRKATDPSYILYDYLAREVFHTYTNDNPVYKLIFQNILFELSEELLGEKTLSASKWQRYLQTEIEDLNRFETKLREAADKIYQKHFLSHDERQNVLKAAGRMEARESTAVRRLETRQVPADQLVAQFIEKTLPFAGKGDSVMDLFTQRFLQEHMPHLLINNLDPENGGAIRRFLEKFRNMNSDQLRENLTALFRIYDRYEPYMLEVNRRIQARGLPQGGAVTHLMFTADGVNGSPMRYVVPGSYSPNRNVIALNFEALRDPQNEDLGFEGMAHEAGHGWVIRALDRRSLPKHLEEDEELYANWAAAHILTQAEIQSFIHRQVEVRLRIAASAGRSAQHAHSQAYLTAFANQNGVDASAVNRLGPVSQPLTAQYEQLYQQLHWVQHSEMRESDGVNEARLLRVLEIREPFQSAQQIPPPEAVVRYLSTSYTWIRLAEKYASKYEKKDASISTAAPTAMLAEVLKTALRDPRIVKVGQESRRSFLKVMGTVFLPKDLRVSSATMAHAQQLLTKGLPVWDVRTRHGQLAKSKWLNNELRDELDRVSESKQPVKKERSQRLLRLSKQPLSEWFEPDNGDNEEFFLWDKPDYVLAEDIRQWIKQNHPEVIQSYLQPLTELNLTYDGKKVYEVKANSKIHEGVTVEDALNDVIDESIVQYLNKKIITGRIHEDILEAMADPSNSLAIDIRKSFLENDYMQQFSIAIIDQIWEFAEKQIGLGGLTEKLSERLKLLGFEIDEDGYAQVNGHGLYVEDPVFGGVGQVIENLIDPLRLRSDLMAKAVVRIFNAVKNPSDVLAGRMLDAAEQRFKQDLAERLAYDAEEAAKRNADKSKSEASTEKAREASPKKSELQTQGSLTHLRGAYQNYVNPIPFFYPHPLNRRPEIRQIAVKASAEIIAKGNVSLDSARKIAGSDIGQVVSGMKSVRNEMRTQFEVKAQARLQQLTDFARQFAQQQAGQKAVVAVEMPGAPDAAEMKRLGAKHAAEAGKLGGLIGQIIVTGASGFRGLFQRFFTLAGLKTQTHAKAEEGLAWTDRVLPVIFEGEPSGSAKINDSLLYITTDYEESSGTPDPETETVAIMLKYVVGIMASLALKPEQIRKAGEVSALLKQLAEIGINANQMFHFENGQIRVRMSQVRQFIESFQASQEFQRAA